MEHQTITLADIFLDLLSKSDDKGTKLATERIKAVIKTPAISELFNICVVNALGFKTTIRSKIVDNGINDIISFVHTRLRTDISLMRIKKGKRSPPNLSPKLLERP